jgi:hypothetical protein
MSKLDTSLTIVRHSLQVLWRNPRLLVFPFISLAGLVFVYLVLIAPALFHVSVAEIWHTLWQPDKPWDAIAPWRAAENADFNPWHGRMLGAYAIAYVLAMFLFTFVQVALYSQIIQAMNGNRVSIWRGFALAAARVEAIAAWSLLAGGVGLLLQALQEFWGVFGKVTSFLAGLTWGAACVFVIPVLINEPATRNPFGFVKISATLIRRVWGEGVMGLGGIGVLYVAVAMCIGLAMPVCVTFAGAEMETTIIAITMLATVMMFALVGLVSGIFQCGLYVYATEGVAPGTFDEEIFERAWTVKPGAATGETATPAGRISWKKLRGFAIAFGGIALSGLSVWLSHFAQSTNRNMPYLGGVAINLADLDYRFSFQDVQAVGLFQGEKCKGCDFSAGGSMKASLDSESGPDFRPSLYRHGNWLYLHFYGDEAAKGSQRMQLVLQALRARFPGHEYAIDLTHGRGIEWAAVPGAEKYVLEIQCLNPPELQKQWCAAWKKIELPARDPGFGFSWVGAQRGRWRVTTMYANGVAGPVSEWTEFDYKNE